MKRIKTINWSSCCICGADGSLRSTEEGIKTLADNVLKHWKGYVLDFNPKNLTENQAKYHHNCSSKYSEYKRLKKSH